MIQQQHLIINHRVGLLKNMLIYEIAMKLDDNQHFILFDDPWLRWDYQMSIIQTRLSRIKLRAYDYCVGADLTKKYIFNRNRTTILIANWQTKIVCIHLDINKLKKYPDDILIRTFKRNNDYIAFSDLFEMMLMTVEPSHKEDNDIYYTVNGDKIGIVHNKNNNTVKLFISW